VVVCQGKEDGGRTIRILVLSIGQAPARLCVSRGDHLSAVSYEPLLPLTTYHRTLPFQTDDTDRQIKRNMPGSNPVPLESLLLPLKPESLQSV
jgi:hypothetical protein